jgi:hypothetical protein
MISNRHLLYPSAWVEDLAGMKLDPWQKEVLDWAHLYQAWCCSRQTGKSTAAAMKTAWQVMTHPGQLVLLFSNSQRQSGELLRKVFDIYGRVIRDDGYDGPKRVNDNAFDFSLDNGSRVLGLPGSEESILGYSPNLVIIDEAAVVSDKFFKAVNPMLARSHGSLIVASTPRGKRGFFWNDVWKIREDSDSQWHTISITAEQSPHIEPKFLEQQLKLLGQDWFDQEYHCRFLEVSGSLFTDDMISAIFTDDGHVIDTKVFEVDLKEEGYGWQGAFENAV